MQENRHVFLRSGALPASPTSQCLLSPPVGGQVFLSSSHHHLACSLLLCFSSSVITQRCDRFSLEKEPVSWLVVRNKICKVSIFRIKHTNQ